MTRSTETPAPLWGTILDQIGSEIVSGAIEPGQTFTLHDISARFGISRTVAREAMRGLEQLGLAASSRRIGLRVLPMSEWSVFDPLIINWRLSHEKTRRGQQDSLNQVRLGIEPIAARLAAQNASPQQRAEICELAQRLQELEEKPSRHVGEELATDLRFHTAVLSASGNEMFAALAPSLLSMLKGKSLFGSEKRNPIAGTSALHKELAAAIEHGDEAEAENLARRILVAASSPSGESR